MDGSIRFMNIIYYRKDITDAYDLRILRIRPSASINSIQLKIIRHYGQFNWPTWKSIRLGTVGGFTVLCPRGRHFISCPAQVQPRQARNRPLK